MTPATMLEALAIWREAGWLRHLDLALARFLHELDPAAPASLLLAAALAAHLEGDGHGALPLAELPEGAQELMAWPEDGLRALHERWTQVAGPGVQGGPANLPSGWAACRLLEVEPTDEAGASPLVCSAGLLYLRRHWRHEVRIAACIRARTAGGLGGPGADTPAGADPAKARAVLDALFGPCSADGATDTDWQRVACALALRGSLTLLTGGPGTGKTYTAARMLAMLQALHTGPQPLRVALAAPTGKAAARLRESMLRGLQGLAGADGAAPGPATWAERLPPARTLHALLGPQPGTRRFRHHAAHPLEVDLVFVDEASMVHLEMMAQLLEALPPNARLVLLGDKDQLASVEAGAVMGDLCEGAGIDSGVDSGGYTSATQAWVREVAGQELPAAACGEGSALAQQTVVLRRARRFDGPIGELARAFNAGDAAQALALLRSGAHAPVALHPVATAAELLEWAVEGRSGVAGGYRGYLQQLRSRPEGEPGFQAWAQEVLRRFDEMRVLAAVREGPWGVAGLNAGIERALAEAGLLSPRAPWYEGRPIIVTRNDPALGVFNGDVGVVLRGPASDAALRGYFLAGGQLRSVAVSRLAHVETAFALTVHKSQGSEFAHVMLVLPQEDTPVLTRELVYTAVTRASAALTVVARHPELLATAARRRTRRVSGLPSRLRA